MTKPLLIIFLSLSFQCLFSQSDHGSLSRSDLDPLLAPFYHGVASGDPASDRVIIWTRLTPDDSGEKQISWRMALDTNLLNIVASGTTVTDEMKDYTVQVDVTGLQANTWYYYEFQHEGQRSLIGRTKTAPAGSVNQVRMAVVSCADYQNGLYNAYREIVNRNDVDVVIHLGDYIYEYGASSSLGRDHVPANEIISLDDYRTRYSHYRLDPDLRLLHQQFPFICVWDDHESANNSWFGGAQNHTPGTEGDWFERKANAIRAHEEWLPIRKPDINDPLRIYRKISYGSLLDLFMLDTRLIARDEQGAGNANTRKLIGEPQFNWLVQEMRNSTATWKIIGQQVMMAPLLAFGVTVNNDQWDGYPGERQALLQAILDHNIQNVVVLTGDIHTAWANDIPFGAYNNSNPNAVTGSAAVEFVTTSITSQSLPLPIPLSLIQSQNSHVRWADLTRKGFLILDITAKRVQSDFVFVSSITNSTFTSSFGAHYFVNSGERFLRSGNAASILLTPLQALAPALPNALSSVRNESDVALVGVYPNPFTDKILIQFNAFSLQNIRMVISDIKGNLIIDRSFNEVDAGLHYLEVFTGNVNPGLYYLSLITPKQRLSRMILKQ